MGRGRSVLVRFGAPVLFLAAATAAVVLVRAGLRQDVNAPPAPRAPAKAAVVSRHLAPARKSKPRGFYVIKPGDTLGAVADRIGTSVDRLLELNPGVRPTSLRIGQRIRTA